MSIPTDGFKVNDARSLQFSVLAELSPLRQTALARMNTTKPRKVALPRPRPEAYDTPIARLI